MDAYSQLQRIQIEQLIHEHNRYVSKRAKDFTNILTVMRDNYGGPIIPPGECTSVHKDHQMSYQKVVDTYDDETDSDILTNMTPIAFR